MTTSTHPDAAGETTLPIGRHDPSEQPAAEPEAATPRAETKPSPLAGWWQAARADTAARKARGGHQRWAVRWTGEQPTSVADHLDYYLHQHDERPDGRRGWGLRTASPLVNGAYRALYRGFGLSVGLAVTLAAYALAWMCQRPGRAVLLAAGLTVVHANLTAWLS